jgi:hypothetical protein
LLKASSVSASASPNLSFSIFASHSAFGLWWLFRYHRLPSGSDESDVVECIEAPSPSPQPSPFT